MKSGGAFEELFNKRIDEIQNMNKQIDFNNLIYHFATLGLAPINIIRFKGPIHIYNDIKIQKQFKSNLSEIITWNANYRKEVQLNTTKNIKNLYNSKEKDYVEIRSEAMYKTKYGTGLKILFSKQML